MATKLGIEKVLLTLGAAREVRFDDPESAEKFLRSALQDAEQLGIVSPSIHFDLATTLRDGGREDLAFEEIRKVLEIDPFDMTARSIARQLAQQLRESLTRTTRLADDPDVPRLYQQLVQAGEADLGCHLTLVRFALATGQLARARCVAEALITVHPAEHAAWEALARVAHAEGNEHRAAEAELECLLLGGAMSPFGSVRQGSA